ncbi:centromere protein J isoform X2 [Cololabis saira]|uniref:centromere protein J isoform X2 n=1 Tax=Cololabis saira TaxID=129043 RepID=UPI002AD35BE1|nr:centromere protein J isoform X2 [Cololabis saira]
MSSPAGLWSSQGDFLARWMPSSSRAGVILSPSPDLSAPLRGVPAPGPAPGPAPPPRAPDDSFSSDFAPLPGSVDSSCAGMDGCPRPLGGEAAGAERTGDSPAPGSTTALITRLSRLDQVADTSRDLPLMMKLDKLRQWQQHMQEQLKAHQLEELLQLQEEQQRLLGIATGSKICNGESTESSGEEWDEDELHPGSDMNRQPLSPPGELEQPSKGQGHEEDGMWNSREEDEKDDTLVEPDGVSEDLRRKEGNSFLDRPIRPGIGGQKQTFEELLEEELRLEEQRLKSAQQQQRQNEAKAAAAPPKRAFLRRGDGLSRFNNKASLQRVEDKKEHRGHAQAIGLSCSSSASTPGQRGGSNTGQRLSVQRKTASLNKENRAMGPCLPPQGNRAEVKTNGTKVLSSQRQNTDGPELGKTRQHRLEQVKEYSDRNVDQSMQVLRSCDPNQQPNAAARQAGASARPPKAGGDAAGEKRFGSGAPFPMRTQSGQEAGAPQDSFESSFREKVQRWECNKQLETMELGEFELLEQAAEELSFSSNSSFVIKVLQMDQQNRQLQNARGLHQRRLSSTPIKSSCRGEAQTLSVQQGEPSSVPLVRADALSSKVLSEAEDGHDSERDGEPEVSDISSGGGSESGEEVMVRVCFPAPSNPPYDKRSYEDEDSFRDSTSEVTAEDGGESDGDSTLMEDKDVRQGRVVFDDDDTWNDLEDAAVSEVSVSRDISPVSKSTAKAVSPVEKTLLRKVAVKKRVEADEEPEPDPPPASQLMTKLFPSLKPKAKNGPPPPPPADLESNKPKDDTGQQAQSRQLREKLIELEIEIERFKKENAALTKLRQENKKNQEDLRKQSLEFEQTKAEELAKFEEYKKEENRKLQKERRLFEKHASAARAIPDKKEREEIQSLKQQLSSVQEEVKRKESRWASTHTRLRQQLDSLNRENGSLRDEIRMLEKLRLSAWKKSSLGAEDDIERRDNAPTLTKGVTFASPVASKGGGCSPAPPCTAAATRGSSKDAAMKSSLKRSSGSGSSSSSSSSSSLPDRRESSPAAVELCSPERGIIASSLSPQRADQRPKPPESSETEEPESSQEVISHPDGRVEKVLVDGDRLIIFPNGTRKEISADGLSAKVTFFNGDTKQITADQRVIYYYAEAQTTHVTYPDGMEVLHFPNNQTEKHFPDGRKEITFPDQTVKNLFPDGREESVLTDGSIIQVNPDGTKEIHFNTGQKETHTADFKRREYLDGTVKTVYTDGRQETRYPTGRLRIKDKDGNVVLDNRL